MRRLAFTLLFALASVCAFAQDAVADLTKFAANVYQFSSVFPQEKVYIQFDNTSYYTGETIWFKAFVVNAADHKRAPSKVLYVDLLSPSGVLLKQQKLKIVAGQCDGSFPLLDASTSQARDLRGVLPYPSGFYEVRAYTMNMLNFSEDAIFSRVLAVYDKPSEEGAYYTEAPGMKLHNSLIEQYRPETEKTDRLDVTFFPEGGHLIAGLPQHVAFKATGKDGLGVDVKGVLNGTETVLETEHDGMGSFEITPTEGRQTATFTLDGKEFNFRLPEAEKTGCTLHATVDPFFINVSTGAKGLPEGTDVLGLTLTCRGSLMAFETIEPGGHVALPIDGITEGVCRLVLFDRSGAVMASRSIYCPGISQTPVLEFTHDQAHYDPFGKIQLDFTLKDAAGAAFRDRFCLSVRDSRGTGSTYMDDLRTSMLLSSDLKGMVYKPDWYFESDDDAHTRALDLLMLVQGWERYDWSTMAGITAFEEKHRVEEGLTLNGWVMNPSGRQPLDSVMVLAAVVPPDKEGTEQFNVITDRNGYFGMDISDFYDVARMTIRSSETKKKRQLGTSVRFVFERSMTPSVRAYEPAETRFVPLGKRTSAALKANAPAEDDGMPKIIYDNIGYLLPDVDIEDKRKYIDYYTFKAFDVQGDVEVEMDRGEFSGDLYGYLLDKGYTFWCQDDSTGEDLGLSPELEGSDEEVAMRISDIARLNGIRSFWYVHNNTKCLYQGIFCPPWMLDTRDLKSIMVYDRVMSLTSVADLAPLFMTGLTHHVDVNTATAMTSAESAHNYYLVDVHVKEDYALARRKELFDIGRRITTVTGFSSPYMFYSPTYPDGPIPGDVDYRRTIFWEPNVVTDAEGHAHVEFYNNSQTSTFSVSAAGMTANGVPYVLDEGF